VAIGVEGDIHGRSSARHAPTLLVPLSAREGSKSVRCRVGWSDVLDEDHCVVLRAYDAFVVQARRVVGPADGMFPLRFGQPLIENRIVVTSPQIDSE
jgi:hypothetical protein